MGGRSDKREFVAWHCLGLNFSFHFAPVRLVHPPAMKRVITRRSFLNTSFRSSLILAGAGLCSPFHSRAVEPIKRAGKPRLQLSLAAYSFRDFLEHKDPDKRITLENFVDFCADHGCAGTELTSYYFPDGFVPDYLIKLKRHAFLRGVAISGSAVGNNFALPKGPKRDEQIALVKKWVDHCAVLGAPHIRVFAGPAQDKDVAAARKLCIEALEECCDYAGQHGIFLGLENHGGIVAEAQDLIEIVQAVKSPWIGINLDTGNFHTDDPYADLAKCAPYAINVQIKVEIRRRGQKANEISDLPRLVKILREVNYQGYVALEYEAKEDPWKAVPAWLEKLKAALAA
jgi:sugar phosphate isomerase/epimerase